ncbi:HipA domain-containing protein [Vibrio tritonius]|uniref:HipA domain-containing protein n=1 Tax=Vibrio tritonius TaxID=1435069 RepID=A0ABS7YNQ2_9VIBR|nr:HipA domain-containing protein [Vibrio tritonius]MCA2017312.1 HipA domain-containing protein [Vibrio tritonius]
MMSGSKRMTLDVYMGGKQKIATIAISTGDESDIQWEYEPSWIKTGFPISPYIPFDAKPSARAVRNYLQNLLPEGKGLEDITTNTTVSKNNTFGLIRIIGEETSGALSFLSTSEHSKQTSFRTISNDELGEKLASLTHTGDSITYWDGQTRLSVAGVQDKLNLLCIEDQFGFGEGELCSNKIFKFETGKAPFIAINEFFTMRLAQLSGIETPHVSLAQFGATRTFIIDRFDRHYSPENHRVLRRHVIDGCQASNLPPSYKYERQFGDDGDGKFMRDGVSFRQLFQIKTTNQPSYHLKLIQWMTFNLLVRNYDAHGKNISYFVGKNGLTVTPFYDLVNIEAIIREANRKAGRELKEDRSNSISRHYAMSIGEYEPATEGNFSNPITAYMLADFALTFEISLPRLQLTMTKMTQSVIDSIQAAKAAAYEYSLDESEKKHINLCIDVIQESSEQLLLEIEQITDMEDLL